MNKKELLELSDTLRGIAEGAHVASFEQWNEDGWINCKLKYRHEPQPPPPDPYAELKAAHAAGKTIQRYEDGGMWTDSIVKDRKQDPFGFVFSPESYRIKPEPRKVPLGPDDVPPGSVFRSKQLPDGWISPTSVSAGAGCYFHDEVVFRYTWSELQEKQEIKRPGEDWQPCWKEIEQ